MESRLNATFYYENRWESLNGPLTAEEAVFYAQGILDFVGDRDPSQLISIFDVSANSVKSSLEILLALKVLGGHLQYSLYASDPIYAHDNDVFTIAQQRCWQLEALGVKTTLGSYYASELSIKKIEDQTEDAVTGADVIIDRLGALWHSQEIIDSLIHLRGLLKPGGILVVDNHPLSDEPLIPGSSHARRPKYSTGFKLHNVLYRALKDGGEKAQSLYTLGFSPHEYEFKVDPSSNFVDRIMILQKREVI